MKAVAPALEIWSLGVQHLLSPMLPTFAQTSVWAFLCQGLGALGIKKAAQSSGFSIKLSGKIT
jgi:hydroxylamine reductase (hybrid-cluster protein)